MMRALLLTPALLLGGCISLLPEQPPPPRIYVLEAGEVERAEAPALAAVIGVAAPSGERSLLGGDLVWREGDELIVIDRSQWSARAETALQSMLVETLARQGRFRAATPVGEARGGRYVNDSKATNTDSLRVALQSFSEPDYGVLELLAKEVTEKIHSAGCEVVDARK